MATRTDGRPDPADLQAQQAEEQRHNQAQGMALEAQQEQLRDLMRNPEVLELLSAPDFPEGAQSDKAWLRELLEEHLTLDQVLSIYDRRDVWEKQWLNGNIADELMASYPSPQSRSTSERVQRVREQIRGDSKRPLTPDERRKIRALCEQKTDREKRAKGGKFMELLLSEVVRSEQSTTKDDDGGGLLDQVLGR